MSELEERISAAIASLKDSGPKEIRRYFSRSRPDLEDATDEQIVKMLDMILDKDPNKPFVRKFESLFRDWDNAKESDSWVSGTLRNTAERRKRIHECLKSGLEFAQKVDLQIPFYHFLRPQQVIAKEHRDWYCPPSDGSDYYWSKYVEYLETKRKWGKASVLQLSNSTRATMENLANPEWADGYSSRGLVMGFVQSGKTANFTGLIARAADAGYKYIIVLAGTMNILRKQTQRRIDKELLGKEFLQDDDVYTISKPEDWDQFLEHGFSPEDRGHYSWSRITRSDGDYRRLRTALDALELERSDKTRPVNDPVNLRKMPVRLFVIKKSRIILDKLCADMRHIKTNRLEIPVLIIDDESDQAGLNTIEPPKPGSKEEIKRTKTNEALVSLLKLFPRAQLVGYTATPYANAFVNPNDPEDLFPKDFFVPLQRPIGYMGISDFFDAERDFEELKKGDFTEKENAFIRRVENEKDKDDEDLKKAIRCYVLSGAVKLYRAEKYPGIYSFRHHTMLIHTDTQKSEHHLTKRRVHELWDDCAFITPSGRKALEKLWNEDFVKVTAAQEPDAKMPESFDALERYVDRAIQKITESPESILVLNSDSKDSPDFSAAPVWKIIVGGNKLSRGYTLEDLTISYYRRTTSAADSLMQMGRWFGFRHGYRDLVRVFLGVAEGRNDIDLVARFKEACLMEERFREELRRYEKPLPGQKRIRPQDIPPLVSMVGQLRPTSPNKMFNAIIEKRNFGGQWSTPTLVATDDAGTRGNIQNLKKLIGGKQVDLFEGLGGKTDKGRDVSVSTYNFGASTEEVRSFLQNFNWLDVGTKKPQEVELQLDFLKRAEHGITSWLVMLPQREESFGHPLHCGGEIPKFSVKERARVPGRGFKVFGESNQRFLAKWMCGQRDEEKEYLAKPNAKTAGMQDKNRGIILIFPVREKKTDRNISIGYEILFPENNLPYQTGFAVRRKDAADAAVVPAA